MERKYLQEKIEEANAKLRKLTFKKRIKLLTFLFLKAILLGLLASIVPILIICPTILLTLVYNYNLPYKAIIIIGFILGFLILCLLFIKFMTIETMIKEIDRLSREKM